MKKIFLSSSQIAEKLGISPVTARVWAKKNNVGYIGEGFRKNYVWSEEDFLKIKKEYSK